MACLDTALLVDLCRRQGARRQRARDKLRELVQRGERLVTTRFNVAELQVGVFRSSDRAREEAAVAAVLTGLRVLIGATALAANELLVTRNPTHFADIPGLAVESY